MIARHSLPHVLIAMPNGVHLSLLSVVLAGCLSAGCQTEPTRQVVIDFDRWGQMSPDEREGACNLMRERLAQLRAGERAGQLGGRDIVCTQGGCFSRPGPLPDDPFGPEAEEMNRLATAIEEHCE